VAFWSSSHRAGPGEGEATREPPLTNLVSPFALTSTLKFGLIFLTLQVLGTLATRRLGEAGFYAVSFVGGLVSSASAVASAAALAAADTLSPSAAGLGALLASLASALMNLPLVARVGGDKALTLRITWVSVGLIVLGIAGALVQFGLTRFFGGG
jgi:uncharacterized membrane protein (DUF4010 family)